MTDGAPQHKETALHGPEALARHRLRRQRMRGFLRALAVTTVVGLGLAGIGWWFISRNIGSYVGNIVREQAAKSLNGRLEFGKLDIAAGGRVILHDAQVFITGDAAPVIEAKQAVVTLNVLTFIGPNRGRRALVASLREPRIRLVREPNGSFNLARLFKPDDPNRQREDIGVSFRIQHGELDFTDLALLEQSYPDLGQPSGFLSEFLAEAGYIAGGPAEVRPHHELVQVDGSGAFNDQREEAQFDLRLKRAAGGGEMRGKGSLKTDGSRFKIDITVLDAELASLRAYALHLLPQLQVVNLANGGAPAGSANPLFGGTLERLRLQFEQQPEQDLLIKLNGQARQLLLRSDSLPELALPRIRVVYDNAKQLASADFVLETLGLEVSGKPTLGLQDEVLGGELRIAGAELASVLAKLKQPAIPLTGKLSAVIALAGTASSPVLQARLDSEPLKYEALRLGELSGAARLDGDVLSSEEIRLSGGELPLKLDGSLNLKDHTGKLTLTASGIGVQQAADIVRRLDQRTSKQKADASGKFALKADITLAGGKPQVAYRVWSDQLRYAGLTVKSADASGSYRQSELKIAAATGVLVTAAPVETPLFTSNGPLRLAFRAGGSVNGLGSAKPTLSLSGKADSQNFSPAQVNASFKANGPLGDPEIKLQLKGPIDGQPVSLAATGRYRQGWSPVTASLTWQQTKIDYTGKIDLAGERLDGKLTASAVDLKRFSGQRDLSGVASVEATLSGKFDKLNIAGRVSAPRISYATGQKRYDIEQLSAGFKLADGNRISVSDGRLTFEGNQLHADGTLGKAGSDLTIASDNFNLLSALALVPPARANADGSVSKASVEPLSIRSSGPLILRLTGTLKEPLADLQYRSGPGSVQGRSFSSASVQASSDRRRATIRSFEIRSEQGQLSATGSVEYEPLRYSGEVRITDFDIGVVAPLLGASALAELRGMLQGSVKLSGGAQNYAADADLRLTGGSFKGYALDSASARLVADANGLQISELKVSSQNTTLTASGTIPKDPAQARFTVNAPQVELALLQPFIPAGGPQLAGTVRLNVDMRPGRGSLPEADLTLQDTGAGITISGRPINTVVAKAQLRNDELIVEQLDLGVQSSSLRLSGTARLKDFEAGEQKPFPLNMNLEASNFNMADVAPLLPQEHRKLLPQGVVTVRPLKLTGTTLNPLLTGSIAFALSRLPAGLPESVTTVAGNVTLADNSFTIVNVDIGTSEGSGAGSLGQASITGSGRLALNPPRLLSGAVNIDLAPPATGGRYVKLEQSNLLGPEVPASRAGSFDGTLGGVLSFTAPTLGEADSSAVLSGRLLITEPSAKSILTLPTPQQSQGPGGSGMRFNKLQVAVQEGTEIRYKPGVDLRASITGDLTLNGVPGLPPGDPDALSISGLLRLTKGSLVVYRHTVRLDESYESTIRFSGRPGDFAPTLSGRGTLVIPNVLEGGDVISTGTPGTIQPTVGPSAARESRDLRVYFTFKDVKLATDGETMPAVTLSSDPPRSPEQILMYLAGGVGDLLTGEGELGDIAEGELVGFGSTWVSRKIEEALGIDSLRFGGSPSNDDDPFYMDIEQELNPQLSVTYFRNFFSQTNQQEEIGLKYRPFREQLDNNLQGLQLEVNFQNDDLRGRGSEFMFTWSKRF